MKTTTDPITIQVDADSLDEAFFNSLTWHLDQAQVRLNKLQKLKSPKPYEKQDIEYLQRLIPAMTIVAEYYGPQ